MSKTQESGQTDDEQIAQSDLSQTDDSQVSEVAQQVDGSSSDLAKQFDGVAKDLKKQFDDRLKKAQSAKDKEFANQSKEINQLKESVVALSQLLKEGVPSAPASRLGNEEQEQASTAVAEAFVLAGIAEDVNAVENSPEYLKFFAQNKGRVDTGKAIQYLRELKQGQQVVSVSAGAIAQPPGGSAQQSSDEQNQIEYVKEMNANRGNVTAIRDVQAKFRKLGVPVEQIGFN